LILSKQMSKAQLRPELLALLQLSAPRVSENEFEAILLSLPASFNWIYFLDRAIATHLAGYLLPYPEIAVKYYPTTVYQKIKSYQQRILLHSVQLREAILALAPQLDAAQIPYALLKGWDLHFRHGASLKQRQISDIDLLVAEKDLDRLDTLLQVNGYQTRKHVYKSLWHKKYQIQHTPLMAVKSKLCIDVHVCLFTSDEPYQIDISKIIDTSVSIQVQDKLSLKFIDKSAAAAHFLLQIHKDLYYGPHFKPALYHDWSKCYQEDYKTEVTFEWNASKEAQKVIDSIENQKVFQFNNEFDKKYLVYLTGGAFSHLLRLQQKWRNFYRRTTPFWLRIPFTWYSIFPNKTYLRNYFGTGNYLNLWLKRLFKLVKPNLKNQ
jgi:hypothetical protein